MLWVVLIWLALTFSYHINVNANNFTISDSGDSFSIMKVETYYDGTLMLQLQDAGDNTRNSHQLDLRLIHPNGIVSTLAVPLTDTNSSDDISAVAFPLSPGYIFVTVVYLSNNTINGKIISWNGDVLQSDVDLDGGTVGSPDSYSFKLNVDPSKNFLWVANITQNSTTNLSWTVLGSKSDHYQFQKLQSGIIKIPESLRLQQFKSFETIEGGFGIAYLTRESSLMTINDDEQFSFSRNGTFLAIPRWQLSVTFLEPEAEKFKQPLLIYQTGVPFDALQLGLNDCSYGLDGSGYSCVLVFSDYKKDPHSSSSGEAYVESLFLRITFLSSGAIKSIINLVPPQEGTDLRFQSLKAIPFGGFLGLYFSNVSKLGVIYDTSGEMVGEIPLAKNVDTYGVFPNNTLYLLNKQLSNQVSLETVEIFTYPLKKILGNDNRFNNPSIEASSPVIGDTIKLSVPKISVTFRLQIEKSVGNVSIFQANGSSPILRQFFSAKTGFCSIQNDSHTIWIDILSSTFNQQGAKYYVTLDNNFVESKSAGQALFGIAKDTWWFSTETRTNLYSDSVQGLLRLDVDGTSYFERLNKEQKAEFFRQMLFEIAQSIPIEQSRLSTSQKYQLDSNSQKRKLLFPLKISDTKNLKKPNAIQVTQDLNTLILNKEISPISIKSSTKFLDTTYGYQRTPNLWEEYKSPLIAWGCGILIITFIYFLARIKYPQGRNRKIFQFSLIVVDFGLDLAFLVYNSRDVPWLFIPCLAVFSVPILLNLLQAFWLLINEITRNEAFAKWFHHHTKSASIITLIAAADVEIVTLLGSRIAGFAFFSAPFSVNANNWIFWSTTINMFIEDLPQLAIQILYRFNTVSYEIIPYLSLIVSSLIMATNIIGRVYNCAEKAQDSHQIKYQEAGEKVNFQQSRLSTITIERKGPSNISHHEYSSS
ncbi:hypothetical protein G9A89_006200 [Geosiphon pyriformis]|nr:hypothetical protein G9A89_006200 [Geosiphon pyriformis]